MSHPILKKKNATDASVSLIWISVMQSKQSNESERLKLGEITEKRHQFRHRKYLFGLCDAGGG